MFLLARLTPATKRQDLQTAPVSQMRMTIAESVSAIQTGVEMTARPITELVIIATVMTVVMVRLLARTVLTTQVIQAIVHVTAYTRIPPWELTTATYTLATVPTIVASVLAVLLKTVWSAWKTLCGLSALVKSSVHARQAGAGMTVTPGQQRLKDVTTCAIASIAAMDQQPRTASVVCQIPASRLKASVHATSAGVGLPVSAMLETATRNVYAALATPRTTASTV